MIIFYGVNVLLMIFIVYRIIRPSETESLSIQNTMSIRGIFIVTIVLHHISMYIGDTHNIVILFYRLSGQIFTSLFFFLSGYGNFISYKKRKHGNIRWLLKRLFILILPFEVVYMPIYFLTSEQFSITGYLYGALTFTMPGVTNWFVKVMLMSYVLFWIIFFGNKLDDRIKSYILVGIIGIAIILGIMFKVPVYWWSSVICFPLGICYAINRNMVEEYLSRDIILLLILFSGTLLFALDVTINRIFEVFACVFICTLIIGFNHRVHISSRVFSFLGKISYEIYLIHVGLIPLYSKNIIKNIDICIIFFISILGAYIVHTLINGIMNKKREVQI